MLNITLAGAGFINDAQALVQNTSACPGGIPIEAFPVIQKATLQAILVYQGVFMLIGLGIGLSFSYVYFQLWKRTHGVGD